ncbi:MAG: hypothetical protein ACI8PG_004459, partial [Planctomycetota bacterium]
AALAALSTEEIQQFIANGFLVKRNVLDPKLCAAARDRLWAGNTSSHLRRDDPKTWLKGIPEADRHSTPDGMNDRTSEYAWRLRELSGDEDMIDLLPRRVFPWFEQLLGAGEVVAPEVSSSAADPDPRGSRLRGWPVWGGKELRGIYCALPKERTSTSTSLADAARAGAHIDPEPMQLVVSGYIDKVPQGGGGIALFPGSHRLLYEAEPASADIARYSILHPPHADSGAAAFVLPQPRGLRDALADIEPFEFFGDEGDVVLWHGRMFHSATPNYSNPPQIRQMITYDAYKKSVYDRVYNGRYVKGPQASPPPSVREHYGLAFGPAAPPPEPRAEGPGLWDDWSESVGTAAATASEV